MFVSLLRFFLAVSIGLMLLVAPVMIALHGVSVQMLAALAGAVVFFALPFQAFRTGRFSPPLTALGLLCLVLALQGWAYVTSFTGDTEATRHLGRRVGSALLSGEFSGQP